MAKNQGTHNQPSHDAQVKGGQHSHQGKQQDTMDNEDVIENKETAGNRTPPTRQEASKGGQHSHSGAKR